MYIDTFNWYLSEKKGKARSSKALRLMSIILGVGGGVVPLLSSGVLVLSPYLGYVLLAGAGACQLIDRYFGYSNSWTRYVRLAMEANRNLLSFQVEWITLKQMNADQAESWALISSYANRLTSMVAEETSGWAENFSSEVQELSRELQNRSASVPA